MFLALGISFFDFLYSSLPFIHCISMAPVQRRCSKCDAFLPHRESDPHEWCARCRGGKCSYEGKKCVYCRDWSKGVWDSLAPISRPYQSRNPATRAKKPGKPRPKPAVSSPGPVPGPAPGPSVTSAGPVSGPVPGPSFVSPGPVPGSAVPGSKTPYPAVPSTSPTSF